VWASTAEDALQTDSELLDLAARVSELWSPAGQPPVWPIDLGIQEESTVLYVTWAVPELIDGSGERREAFSFQSPADNAVWSHPDELGLEIGKPRIDRLAATEVRLGSAPNLDGMSPGRRGVVDQEGNVGILQHVSPLLGIAKVNASDIDCVHIGIEPVGERDEM